MASSSQPGKEKTTFEVQLIRNELKQPNFKAILEVAYKNDPASALSVIPPKVIMIQDVRKCYNCKVRGVGDLELREAYNRLCENGALKEEFNIVEKKGLTRALEFTTAFKTEWIKIMLSKIHDNYIWLEGGPIRITKKIIHRVTRFPTLEQQKSLRNDAKETIEKNTGAKWNKRGMTIDTITDPLVNFAVRVISHNFYQSSILNSVPCIVVDVGYKIVKKDHTYDLTELQLQQIMENLGAIGRTKGAHCKFGSILVCIFFYVQNEFPSFGKIGWKANRLIVVQINEYIE